MDIRLATPPYFDSIVDGPGLRAVLFTQGCEHNCIGCHNPNTHSLEDGTLFSVSDVIATLEQSQLQTGLTISGGEPLLQAAQLVPIAAWAKQQGWNVWMYTGFTFEYLSSHRHLPIWNDDLFQLLDVVVDGPFIQAKKDLTLPFRGSSNQRLLDWQNSLIQNKAIPIS